MNFQTTTLEKQFENSAKLQKAIRTHLSGLGYAK